jgi:hypothetical protein
VWVGAGSGVDVANTAAVEVGVGDNLTVALVEPQATSRLLTKAIQSMVIIALFDVPVWRRQKRVDSRWKVLESMGVLQQK